MITIHQRHQDVSNDDDTVSKSAQNSLLWVLPDKYFTDWRTILLVLSLPIHFSLFLPSTNMSLSEKSTVLLSLVINNSPMNRFPISNSTYVQISFVKYIPLLCQIWPDFIQKNSLFYQQSLGTIQTCIPNSVFTWWRDQTYSSANYIHCSAKLSVTVHNSPQFTSKTVRFSSEVELQIFFFPWGSSLE